MPIGGYGLGAATGLDGKIYALGGYRQNYGDPALHIGGTLPYVQIYDPATGTWTAQKTMPTPRMYLGVVREKDGRIVAVGGTHPFAGALDVVEAYDPADGSWSSLPSLPTGREDLAAAASRNGSIYAIGGFDGHRTFLSTMDVYTP
jgi:N-acetylneuraminic acid mutarotase